MTTRNFYQTIIALFIILIFNSCTQESIFDETQEIENSFKIVPLSENNNYTKNYEVNSTTTKIDIANDLISLEIPVPLADYSLLRVYNISTEKTPAILYLIGREDTNSVVDMPINYVIKDQLKISDLQLDTNLMKNYNGLRIFVMNNSQELSVDAAVYNCVSDKVDAAKGNALNCNVITKAADGPMFLENGDVIFG